ncbi:MAG: hypothetical protein JWM37_195 [Candidatus Saccharibacteria bacterium]|nr:hypothetical protein [Candidatus Saccharibacteria bacterium]
MAKMSATPFPYENIDFSNTDDPFAIALGEARFKLSRAVAFGRLSLKQTYVMLDINMSNVQHRTASYKLSEHYRRGLYGQAENLEISVPILNANILRPLIAVGEGYDYFQVTGLHDGLETTYTVDRENYDELSEDPALPTHLILPKLVTYSVIPANQPLG